MKIREKRFLSRLLRNVSFLTNYATRCNIFAWFRRFCCFSIRRLLNTRDPPVWRQAIITTRPRPEPSRFLRQPVVLASRSKACVAEFPDGPRKIYTRKPGESITRALLPFGKSLKATSAQLVAYKCARETENADLGLKMVYTITTESERTADSDTCLEFCNLVS